MTRGPCSLREAIAVSNADAAADSIALDATNTYTLTRTGTNEDVNSTGDLDVLQPLTIIGNSSNARDTIIQAGTDTSNGIDRVLHVSSSGSLTMNGVTVRYGRLTGTNGVLDGGGILSDRPMTLTDVAVVDNRIIGNPGDTRLGGGIKTASGGTLQFNRGLVARNSVTSGSNKNGGGLHLEGNTTLRNVTVEDNTASDQGGGVRVTGNTTHLTNVTISDNDAATGGGVRRDSGTIRLRNVLLSGNTAASGANCSTNDASQFINNSNNLDSGASCGFAAGFSNQNANLQPLANNGGPTDTRALGTSPMSAAIDTGTSADGDGHDVRAEDQRLAVRPQDGDGNGSALYDIGAYEGAAMAQVLATTLVADNATGTYGGTTTLTATLTTTVGGTPVPGKTISFSLNGNSVGSAVTNASGVATLNNASLSGINAGPYPGGVSASFTTDATHTGSSDTADLTVNKKPLDVTASSHSVTYGDAVPTVTCSYDNTDFVGV